MSQEQLQSFITRVQGNAQIQDQLKASMSSNQVESITRDLGYDFSLGSIAEFNDHCLSNADLERVAGGSSTEPGLTATKCIDCEF